MSLLIQFPFDQAFDWVIGVEGAYNNDPNDSGNWTGCAPGEGEFKGTNWGISACVYKNLDIINLTKEQAKAIYYRDYWLLSGSDSEHWPLALVIFDSAVQHGAPQAKDWLEESQRNISKYIALRIQHYTRLNSWPRYGGAWMRRISRLLTEVSEAEMALKMEQ